MNERASEQTAQQRCWRTGVPVNRGAGEQGRHDKTVCPLYRGDAENFNSGFYLLGPALSDVFLTLNYKYKLVSEGDLLHWSQKRKCQTTSPEEHIVLIYYRMQFKKNIFEVSLSGSKCRARNTGGWGSGLASHLRAPSLLSAASRVWRTSTHLLPRGTTF